MKLSDYEIQVLSIMLKNHFSSREIEELCESEIHEFEFTGAGYFLQLRSKILPKLRKVISEPDIIGKAGNCMLGFILYLEDQSLTLECHSWGIENPPESIREEQVIIEITN